MDKSILEELCANLEIELNLQAHRKGKPSMHTVELVSGLKPYNYYLPMMHVGTTKSISDEIMMAWFVEVKVDRKCIFRESYLPRENEDLEIVEGMMITRVLSSIFNYGVMSSKTEIDKRITTNQNINQ